MRSTEDTRRRRMERASERIASAYSLDKRAIVGPGEHAGIITEASAWWYSSDEARSNAARIVACVNALEGVADPAGWVAAVGELTVAVRLTLDPRHRGSTESLKTLRTTLAALEK